MRALRCARGCRALPQLKRSTPSPMTRTIKQKQGGSKDRRQEGSVPRFIILLAFVLGLGTASAADNALIEAAKKEGALTLYACDPPQTPLYVDRFRQLYPDIKVTSYVAGCWQIF